MISWRKHLLAAAIATTVAGFSFSAQAAPSGFMESVPAGDSSYYTINRLIATGNVDGYTEQIPAGQSISRMEMAMIIDSAMQNYDSFSSSDQEQLDELNREYLYDIKRVRLLNRLDSLDNRTLSAIEHGAVQPTPQAPRRNPNEVPFTKEDKSRLDKVADALEKINFAAYGELRNDHYVTKTAAGVKTRKTRSNYLRVSLYSNYKVNDRWSLHALFSQRVSMKHPELYDLDGYSYFQEATEDAEARGTRWEPEVWAIAHLPNHIDLKFGRWNEWTVEGHGFDVDCDAAGGQVTFGNALKTTISAKKINFWDYAAPNTATSNYLAAHGESPNGQWGEDFVGIRWDYPFAERSHWHWGVNRTSAMAACYQDAVQRKHVISYYTHATHYLPGGDWRVDAGIIYSNAKAFPVEYLGFSPHKTPGIWLGCQYKQVDPNKKGTWDVWLTYRQEPALTWSTYTDWWTANERGARIGFDYVLDKNIIFDTWYSHSKNIDTDLKRDFWRFKLDFLI